MSAQKQILNSNLNLVDINTWSVRLSTCKKCEYYESYEQNKDIFKCNKCGCPGFKFLLQTAKCPLKKPKWR